MFDQFDFYLFTIKVEQFLVNVPGFVIAVFQRIYLVPVEIAVFSGCLYADLTAAPATAQKAFNCFLISFFNIVCSSVFCLILKKQP